MDDLIYRSEAIKAIKDDAGWLASQGSDWQNERMERDISILQEILPATSEIIQCKNCKWFIKEDIGCILVDGLEYPTENDFCSHAERKQ